MLYTNVIILRFVILRSMQFRLHLFEVLFRFKIFTFLYYFLLKKKILSDYPVFIFFLIPNSVIFLTVKIEFS